MPELTEHEKYSICFTVLVITIMHTTGRNQQDAAVLALEFIAHGEMLLAASKRPETVN